MVTSLAALALEPGPLFEVLALLLLLGCFGLLWRFRPDAMNEAVTSGLDHRLEPLRRFAQRPVAPILSVGLLAFASCVVFAWVHSWPMPTYSDEYAYLLAGDTFAHGRLTNPAHALWPHFEANSIMQQPTYQGKYPPGQGLILALGILLGHPAIGVWLSVGALTAAITWMLRVWLSPGWALVGGVAFALRFGVGSYWAQSYWGGAVAAAGAALAYGGFRLVLTSTTRRRVVGASMLGIGLGVMANTRPFEGLAASLPMVLWLGIWVVSGWPAGGSRPSKGAVLGLAVGVAAGLLPFLGFLGTYNHQVTGDALRMPYSVYSQRYSRLPIFVFMDLKPDEEQGPEEMKACDQYLVNRFFEPDAIWVGPRDAWSRLAALLLESLGAALFIGWVCGLWWSAHERWTLLAIAHLGLAFSANLFVHWFFLHYAAPSVPLVLLLAFAGLRAIDVRTRGSLPWGRIMVTLLLILQPIVAMRSLTEAPEISDWSGQRNALERQLAEQGGRHLLIVRYGQFHICDWEWVFNGADLESQDVVWARDLGERRNRELMAAFPEHQPWLVLVDDSYRGPGLAEGVPPVAQVQPYPSLTE